MRLATLVLKRVLLRVLFSLPEFPVLIDTTCKFFPAWSLFLHFLFFSFAFSAHRGSTERRVDAHNRLFPRR